MYCTVNVRIFSGWPGLRVGAATLGSVSRVLGTLASGQVATIVVHGRTRSAVLARLQLAAEVRGNGRGTASR